MPAGQSLESNFLSSLTGEEVGERMQGAEVVERDVGGWSGGELSRLSTEPGHNIRPSSWLLCPELLAYHSIGV